MPILFALPFCSKDQDLALWALKAGLKLDGYRQQRFDCILSYEPGSNISEVRELAKQYFKNVHELPQDKQPSGQVWPFYSNRAWQQTMRHVEMTWGNKEKFVYTGVFWWEPDAVPVRKAWMETLNELHSQKRCPFSGFKVQEGNQWWMNGVGVWPVRISDFLPNSGAMWSANIPFDLLAAREIAKQKFNELNGFLVHRRKSVGGGEGVTFSTKEVKEFLRKNPEAVFFHGCTDASLHQIIAEERPVVKKAPKRRAAPKRRRWWKKINTFYHSGSLGDVIYALPIIKTLGGGKLYLGPLTRSDRKPRNPVDYEQYKIIEPLLKEQSYLYEVRYVSELPAVDYDLSTFRDYLKVHPDRSVNLSRIMLRHFNLDESAADDSWLEVNSKTPPSSVAVSRTSRYQGELDWNKVISKYKPFFLGLNEEHEQFSEQFGEVVYQPTENLLEAARYLAGSELLVTNQNVIRAIAEGLKMPVIVEESREVPDTRFFRCDAIYGNPVHWPEPGKSPALYTISVLCHNKLDLTKKCLESVLKYSGTAKVVVTDNGSWDGTYEYLKSLPVEVHRNEENLGFIEPHNKIYRQSRTPYFVVINNDLEVCENWLEEMRKELEKGPKNALCGLKKTCGSLKDNFDGYPGDKLEYVEASCMMVKVSLMQETNEPLFNSDLRFAYGEDSDLSLRIRERGYKITLVDLPIEHLRAATSQNRPGLQRKIELQKAANHTILQKRWSFYLRNRHFGYKVLVRRKAARGDVLLVTPVVAAIKKKWPESKIYVQTDIPEIFENNPHVEMAGHHIPVNCDVVFPLDMTYEHDRFRPVRDVYAEACDVYLSERLPSLFPSSRDYARAEELLNGVPYLVVHPGPTTWVGKNWPVDYWKTLIEKVSIPVAVIGDKSTPEFPNTLHLAGKTNFLETAAVIAKAKGFVGLDSFPAHVAQAMRTKTLVLFGATLPDTLYEPVDWFRSICGTTSCAGEHNRVHEVRTITRCDGACMRSIPPGKVLKKIQSFL